MDVAPACRLTPTSSEDVSAIVSTAIELDCKFAIHSGGHMMSEGQSNIGIDGFTIDTVGLNTLELSQDESQVTLGPGNRWGGVLNTLSQKNLTVVGGRDVSVGVGGFLLGGTFANILTASIITWHGLILGHVPGGISLLSYEHGLAADNVIEYEIVIASGEILRASEDKNADLWWALKLGSTNYGVVTAYTVKTYQIGAFWGGIRVFSLEDSMKIVSRFAEMAENANGDPTTGMTSLIYNVNGTDVVFMLVLGFRTDKPEPGLYKILAGGLKPIQDSMIQGGIMDYINASYYPPGPRPRTLIYTRHLLVDGELPLRARRLKISN